MIARPLNCSNPSSLNSGGAIALYPDGLLANVLAASTYPLEVVQADRWLNERKNLKGDALKTRSTSSAGTEASRRWPPPPTS